MSKSEPRRVKKYNKPWTQGLRNEFEIVIMLLQMGSGFHSIFKAGKGENIHLKKSLY